MTLWHLRTDVGFDRTGGGPEQMLAWARKAVIADELMQAADHWIHDARKTNNLGAIKIMGLVRQKAQTDLINALDNVAAIFNMMVRSTEDGSTEHYRKAIEEIKVSEADHSPGPTIESRLAEGEALPNALG